MKFLKPSRTVRIPLIYGIFSIVWILASDQIMYLAAPDLKSATLLAIIKGSAFVLTSTVLIYTLLKVDEKQQKSLQSELQKVQDSFTRMFARNPQPMWLNDTEGFHFLAVNEAACKLYGYSQDEFLKLKFADLCVPEETPLVLQAMGKIFAGIKNSGPWRLLSSSGEILMTNLVFVNFEYSGQNAVLVTAIDISQQKQIEETLKKTVSERDAFESFGYSVSHDLRSQLRAVTGYSQVLLDDFGPKMDPSAIDYLEKLQQASVNMNRTIDNMLILSQISHSPITIERVDLSEIARHISDSLKMNAPERKVEFKIRPEVRVQADPGLMTIVMTDLLENAWKYTSEHETAIIEFGLKTDEAGEKVYFVKDDGTGFDPQKITLMFKPFQRFHPQAQYPGSGIGLSIVAKIIERHHGRIWAEGALEKGATFYFTLGSEQ